MPPLMPVINYTFSADNKTIFVTIPASEQSKFAISTNYQIIFSVFWTNAVYSSIINPLAYTFQNVMYSINFNANGITLIPAVTTSSSYATIG